MTTAALLLDDLRSRASETERRKYERYFPPDPADPDPFLGVRMGEVFALAKTALELPGAELEALLARPEHEARALACSIMGKACARRSTPEARRGELYALALARHDRIDRWDLVDLMARDVVGGWLVDRDRSPLDALAGSTAWPERRTALVACFAFLRRADADDAYRLAERLAGDEAPFVAKAVGWVLRAAGDVDRPRLLAFVERNAPRMPRVAVRAALEHVEPAERTRLLSIR